MAQEVSLLGLPSGKRFRGTVEGCNKTRDPRGCQSVKVALGQQVAGANLQAFSNLSQVLQSEVSPSSLHGMKVGGNKACLLTELSKGERCPEACSFDLTPTSGENFVWRSTFHFRTVGSFTHCIAFLSLC